MEAPKKIKKSKSSKDKKIKKSGVRTKFLIESLRNEYYELKSENEKLRAIVEQNMSYGVAKGILDQCHDPNAPKASAADIDKLTSELGQAGLDDDDDAVGY